MSGHPSRGAPLPNGACPVCLGPNHCTPASSGSFDLRCWCSGIEIGADILDRIPAGQLGRACLCPRCAGVPDGEGVERASP